MSGPAVTPYADIAELDKYKLVSNIGKGSFGVISKVQRIDDGREFAMKQIDYSKMTDKDRKQITSEVAILETLKHRNIVQLIQKVQDHKNERIYIIMEYCSSGDLGVLIRKAQRTGQPIHEDKIWNIFLQIVLALHHCHWPIFLSDEFVKLGDFGLSKDMAGSAFTSTYVGTPLYMPPEILGENRYDTKSDIWSLGCLVFEMCSLTSPFSTARTQEELISMVRSGKLPPLPAAISPSLKSVIRAMLNLNPARRPSTKDLLDMPEMQLHRKMFMVQNQMALVTQKKNDLVRLEAQLQARRAELEARETDLAAREQAQEDREALVHAYEQRLREREQAVNQKEANVQETNKRMAAAAENLRAQWGQFKKEREKNDRDATTGGLIESVPVSTVPVASASRFSRHPFYEDTPSKIPMSAAAASPAPLGLGIGQAPLRQGTPLRRNATKSLGSLAAQACLDAERAAAATEATPSRPVQRTSIGSPSELARQRYESYDISMASMASPAPSSVTSPFIVRPRKSSAAPLATWLNKASSESPDAATTAPVPPTMIPAPVPTYTYRPDATPAKWTVDDPDLPSPFIRRASTAPLYIASAPLALDRAPLGLINPQPQRAPAAEPATSAAGPGRKTAMPRSRSGTLHQHVLRQNATHAARVSGEGVGGTDAPAAAGPLGPRKIGVAR
ncbi:hypothetical protein Q5752_006884 [Cryptotrichosporon argae]